jgi:hypothetical protein
MCAVAEGIVRVFERRHEIKGLRFVYEPVKLRFFQGRFESLENATNAPLGVADPVTGMAKGKVQR